MAPVRVRASRRLRQRVVTISAWACIVVPVLFLGYDLLSIMLNQGYSPLEHTISEFAIQPFGWIERLGIFTLGLTLLGVGISWFYWLARRSGVLFRLAGAMVELLGLGFVLLGAFNADVTHLNQTWHGLIHNVTTAVVLGLFPVFCVVLAVSLWRKREHKWLALYTGVTGVVSLLFLLTRLVPVLNSLPLGLFERIVASLDLLWLIVGGSQVTREALETGADGRPVQHLG